LSPARGVEHTEMQGILSRALGNLDPQMRAVLVLRDMQDLEYSQIAEVLNVPVGTVKSRLFRARVALRTAVEAEAARGGNEP
ncbi:MAG: RNA polymerase sigma factor, partial [Planctomycetota bacterium]